MSHNLWVRPLVIFEVTYLEHLLQSSVTIAIIPCMHKQPCLLLHPLYPTEFGWMLIGRWQQRASWRTDVALITLKPSRPNFCQFLFQSKNLFSFLKGTKTEIEKAKKCRTDRFCVEKSPKREKNAKIREFLKPLKKETNERKFENFTGNSEIQFRYFGKKHLFCKLIIFLAVQKKTS